MQNLEGKTIIYLTDVSAPASQAGKMGETKVVTREGNFAANFLVRGQRIRVIEPAEVHAVRVELGLEEAKPKPKRRAHGPGPDSRRNQKEPDSVQGVQPAKTD